MIHEEKPRNVVITPTQNGKKAPGIVVEITPGPDWYKAAIAEAKSRSRLSQYQSWQFK